MTSTPEQQTELQPNPLLAEAVARAALMYRGALELGMADMTAGARAALFAELEKWEAQFDVE